MRKLLQIFLSVFFVFVMVFAARADELDDITSQLNALQAEVQSKEANKADLVKQIDGIRGRVQAIGAEVVKKEQAVAEGEKNLTKQKKLLNERARSYYKNINKSGSALIYLLIAENLSDSLQNFFYQKVVVDEDRNAIVKIVLYIKNLEDAKQSLVNEKTQLAAINKQLDAQTQALEGEIAGARSKIAQLSARQQELVAAKLASLNIPRSAGSGAGGCSSDLTNGKDPGFSPRIAFFTYGVPNRVGLNQYGAKGRADAGQSFEDILRAYYNYDSLQDMDTNIKIRVDGHGEYSLEDYVKRIYEIPADWPMEALKAQAVAARSYALAYTSNGAGSICDSQYCQVFQDNEKGGRWNEAVEATRGKAMVQGGTPIKAWFSSTHGGYVFASNEIGWSGTSWTKHATDASGGVGSFSELNERAYDKASPWFYCDWGSRSEYGGTAWLKQSEVADIVNVISLAKRDSSVGEHLYQPDKSNPAGTDTWDAARVRSELSSRGGTPYSSVSSVSISADFGSGRTSTVTVNGDGGSQSFSGSEFKDWFNLRAPANIQIVGPLFNVETQ